MRVADLSPWVLGGGAAALGLAAGLASARLADLLPARYGITHLTSGAKRSRRNAAVVALTAASALALALVAWREPEASASSAAVWLVTNVLCAGALLAASAIDLEHMILPNEITIGGAILCLATAHFRRVGVVGGLVGAAVGLAVAYVPFLIYKRLRGHSGMGLGDAKLLVLVGAWHGFEGALFVLFAGAVQSVLCAALMRLVGVTYQVPESVAAELRELRAQADAGDEEAKELLADDPMAADVGTGLLSTRLPLGPFLALGALEFLFARRPILAAVDYLLGG